MKVSIALHLVGIVMWLGGLMILTRFMQLLTIGSSNPAHNETAKFSKRVYFGFVIPGFLLTLFTAVYQLITVGVSVYMKQGWFHGKLTLSIVLFVVTILVLAQISKAVEGQALKKGKLVALHAISASILIANVFLTILGR